MNILIDVKVADNLMVRDFEIIDGLVFFCGESSGGSGFLGWFDINDLFANAIGVTLGWLVVLAFKKRKSRRA